MSLHFLLCLFIQITVFTEYCNIEIYLWAESCGCDGSTCKLHSNRSAVSTFVQ